MYQTKIEEIILNGESFTNKFQAIDFMKTDDNENFFSSIYNDFLLWKWKILVVEESLENGGGYNGNLRHGVYAYDSDSFQKDESDDDEESE